MNKNLQVKDQQKKSANVQRSSSYRMALRRSAPPPPESEDLLTKNDENTAESEKTVVTQQPTNGNKKSFDDSVVEQTEPMIIDEKSDSINNGYKTEELNGHTIRNTENECTKFCCQRVCCNYCKCCPNCCLLKMKRFESMLTNFTDCGLNCLRVFT